MLEENRAKEKERWELAAFVGWQIVAPIVALVSKDDVPTFGDYLAQLNLGDKPAEPPKPPKPKQTAAELIAWANALTEKARAEKAKEQTG